MNIKAHATESLDQIALAITHLNVEEYSRPLDVLSGNSIGKHVRHVVEFFECLNLGCTHLTINYDDRKRNLFLETDPDYTLMRIGELQHEIDDYEEKMLTLMVDYGTGKQSIYTTLFRELAYNIEHTVHHLAIIKIGMERHFPHVNLGSNLGVAYSTQQHQKATV